VSAPETNVSSQYGAPMGRGGGRLSDLRGRVSVRRVRLNSGGYDKGGAYWGTGAPLFYATGSEEGEAYFRAPDRETAVRRALPFMERSVLEWARNAFEAFESRSRSNAETFLANPEEVSAAKRAEKKGLIALRKAETKTAGFRDYYATLTPLGLETLNWIRASARVPY
jgi:hypothetical protein